MRFSVLDPIYRLAAGTKPSLQLECSRQLPEFDYIIVGRRHGGLRAREIAFRRIPTRGVLESGWQGTNYSGSRCRFGISHDGIRAHCVRQDGAPTGAM